LGRLWSHAHRPRGLEQREAIMSDTALRITLTHEQLCSLIDERVAAALAGLQSRQQPAAEPEWIRGAKAIAKRIGDVDDDGKPKPGRVYALAECRPPRIPVYRDGSILVARGSELDAWVRAGGGKRP
jgi:hypothetical protein